MKTKSVIGILLLLVACSTVVAGVAIRITTPIEYEHKSHSDAGAKRFSVLNGGAGIDSYNMDIDDVIQIVKNPSFPSPEIKVCKGTPGGGPLTGELYNCPGGGCDCSESERIQVIEFELNWTDCISSTSRQCADID